MDAGELEVGRGSGAGRRLEEPWAVLGRRTGSKQGVSQFNSLLQLPVNTFTKLPRHGGMYPSGVD